jgi:hypothetical protein
MLVVYLVCSRRLEFLGTRSLALFDLGSASELVNARHILQQD